MFDVCVFENGELIGKMSPEEFRRATKAPSRQFLSDAIQEFNAQREVRDDPTRVKLVLNNKITVDK